MTDETTQIWIPDEATQIWSIATICAFIELLIKRGFITDDEAKSIFIRANEIYNATMKEVGDGG